MLIFDTVENGLKILINDYATNSEVCEGEYADYLANNLPACFDKSVPSSIAMMVIQAFRAWDYSREEEPEEMFGGVQIEAEVNMLETECGLENEFQDYCFADGVFVPKGTRIGLENEEGDLVLDPGIYFPSEGRVRKDELVPSAGAEISSFLEKNTTPLTTTTLKLK